MKSSIESAVQLFYFHFHNRSVTVKTRGDSSVDLISVESMRFVL